MTATASVLPPGAGGRVLDFRRRGTPPRRRRRSALLALLKPLAAAFGLVALPAGLVAWVLTAPLFRLRTVEVGGPSRRVPDGWVRQALAPFEGKNLVRLSLAEAASRVQRNPWIDSVEMVKELPGRLRVRVAERRPVALLLAGGALVYADSDGRAIAPVTTPAELEDARAAGLLVVSFAHPPQAGGVGAALKIAAELGRVQPTWAAKLARIEVLGEEDFQLWTDALPFPLLVTSGQVGPKVQRLVALLPELARRYPRIAAVDLRFSRRIVVQPAVSPPPPGGTGA
ncbi:MAG TPA: FtsQ-type POTRA domain-containing protein [Thermoanaerobaculia bacterium]|jgi:cell division septal protein FtsQ